MNIRRMSLKALAFFSLTVVSLLAGVGPASAASSAATIKSSSQETVLLPGQSITLSVPCTAVAPGCGANGFALLDANVNLSIEVVQCGLAAGDSCSVDITGNFGPQVAGESGSFNFNFPFGNLTGATKQVAFTGYSTIISNPSNAQDQVTVTISWTAVYDTKE